MNFRLALRMFLSTAFGAVSAVSVSAQTTENSQEPIAKSSLAVPPGLVSAPGGKFLPLRSRMNTKVGSRSTGELNLPVPDNSLWFRYYKAGEAANLKRDEKLAKKYWMASLDALEKVQPNPNDDLMSVKLSALEQALTYSYPSDWSKLSEPDNEKLKHQEEQVSTLLKMARINRKLVPTDTLLCQKSSERYDIAKKNYDAAVSESKAKASFDKAPKPN